MHHISPEPPALTPAALSQLEDAMRQCTALARPFEATVYRIAKQQWANRTDLLSGVGSEKYGHRWNPRGVRAAYTSLDVVTLVLESVEEKLANGLPISQSMPAVLTAIEVTLARVLYLSAPDVKGVLEPLGYTEEWMISEPWRKRLESNASELGLTIEMGRMASEFKLQGMVVPSKANPGGQNLVIYPHHCPIGSLCIVNDQDLPQPPSSQ